MIVKKNYPVTSVVLGFIGGYAYSGFDRFGRVVDQRWAGGCGDVDRFGYGYDRNSNRTYRTNDVAASQNTPVHLDELFGYDQLDRLTASHRGQLVDQNRITDHKLSQTWQLDATGNWNQFASYDQANSADVLVQQRSHNDVNEITSISETVGTQCATPAHDRNGNMTSIPQSNDPANSYTLIWEVWNRLVEVNDGGITIARHGYDGQTKRTGIIY